MKNLTEKIYKEILSRKSALIIGRTNSGKTHYVLNEIEYLIDNIKTIDWGTAVKCFVF